MANSTYLPWAEYAMVPHSMDKESSLLGGRVNNGLLGLFEEVFLLPN